MDREAMIAALIFGGSGSGGGGGADAPFVIKFTKQNNTIKTDKTSTEIGDALTAGKPMVALATRDIFGGNQADIIQFELANTEEFFIGSGIEFVSRAVFYGDNTYATISAYRITGKSILGSWSWEAHTDPIYLPRVTNSDDGKVLGVSSGAWGAVADKGEPFYVTFTITGQPVSGVYPLSADKTLAEIDAAIDAGCDIIGQISLDGITIFTARTSAIEYDANDDLDFVSFSLMGILNGFPVLGVLEYPDSGSIRLGMFPLSTAQMTYDSTTQTLAILDPLA